MELYQIIFFILGIFLGIVVVKFIKILITDLKAGEEDLREGEENIYLNALEKRERTYQRLNKD